MHTDIQQEWMERWTGNLELNNDFHLPAENKFIGGWIDVFVHYGGKKKMFLWQEKYLKSVQKENH